MKNSELIAILEALEKGNPTIFFDTLVAISVRNNIDTEDADKFDSACNGLTKVLNEHYHGEWPDFDDITYNAKILVENGDYPTYTLACWRKAYDEAKAQ